MKYFIVPYAILMILSIGNISRMVAMPEVHFTANDECRRVINYTYTDYTCKNLPSKYRYMYIPK